MRKKRAPVLRALGISLSSLNRNQIIEKVCNSADKYGSSNPQQLEQLIFVFSRASQREAFFGLFAFFYDPSLQENEYERQKLAGIILLTICPEPALKLDGSVYAAALTWNFSVEELPWYWCKTFGSSVVITFITGLIADSDEQLTKSLETMLFWLRRYEN